MSADIQKREGQSWPSTDHIHIEALGKAYGAITALEPTSLIVRKGEFLTLLGPSGSGKTTLLQMICGLIEPTSGRIVIDGCDITDLPVHKRDLGLVFQHYALFPHLTVYQNIAFPLEMRGVAKDQIRKDVEETLALVQLGSLSDRYPRELSGGQQQRVALARCFVFKPSIILMDEPLGALDKNLREHMQSEIKRLHRITGTTIIYVTHDQEEALALSDRICLLNHARIEQIDTPRNIYNRPRTEFAAKFIGLSNILKGKINQSEQGLQLQFSTCAVVLPEATKGSGEQCALLVRPEDIELGSAHPNVLKGSVVEVIYAGSETRLVVEIEPELRVTVRVGDTAELEIGQRISLTWPTERGVLLQ